MTNTTKTARANIVVFQDRASKLWVVRDRVAKRDIAHENTKREALIAAQAAR